MLVMWECVIPVYTTAVYFFGGISLSGGSIALPDMAQLHSL